MQSKSHAYFFPQCNLFKTFLIIFQINQVFPENMLPRVFPVLKGRLINLSFLLPIYWFLYSTIWEFTLTISGSWETTLYGRGGLSSLGARWSTFLWDLSQGDPWGWRVPSLLVPSLLASRLSESSIVGSWGHHHPSVAVGVSKVCIPSLSPPLFKKTCGIKPNFLIVVLLDIVNTVLYLLSQH